MCSRAHEREHSFKQANVVFTGLTCEMVVSSACILGLRRNVPSEVMWMGAEGAGPCPVITPPSAKGVFIWDEGLLGYVFTYVGWHFHWVGALAAGDPWGPRGDQPLSARSVHLFPCHLCPPGT